MKLLLSVVLAGAITVPALAQPVAPPPGPDASTARDAAVAHHDRKVAHRAARHGNYRKAAIANHDANAAAADSAAPR